MKHPTHLLKHNDLGEKVALLLFLSILAISRFQLSEFNLMNYACKLLNFKLARSAAGRHIGIVSCATMTCRHLEFMGGWSYTWQLQACICLDHASTGVLVSTFVVVMGSGRLTVFSVSKTLAIFWLYIEMPHSVCALFLPRALL